MFQLETTAHKNSNKRFSFLFLTLWCPSITSHSCNLLFHLFIKSYSWFSCGLRRISCHGRNHSQASCEYSLTIFLCCQHHSEYSLLGSKFSTNLLFAESKSKSQCNNVAVRVFKMAEPDGIVAVVKHCWLLVQGRRGCRERSLNTTTG